MPARFCVSVSSRPAPHEPPCPPDRPAAETAVHAGEHGSATARTEEHHGAEDAWPPSPFVFAGAVLGAVRRIAVTVPAEVGHRRPHRRADSARPSVP